MIVDRLASQSLPGRLKESGDPSRRDEAIPDRLKESGIPPSETSGIPD